MMSAKYFEYYTIILRGGRFFVDTLLERRKMQSRLKQNTCLKHDVIGCRLDWIESKCCHLAERWQPRTYFYHQCFVFNDLVFFILQIQTA